MNDEFERIRNEADLSWMKDVLERFWKETDVSDGR
jgi:hypothetical protein